MHAFYELSLWILHHFLLTSADFHHGLLGFCYMLLNTKGGSALAARCTASADVGKQVLVPYTADYYFSRSNK